MSQKIRLILENRDTGSKASNMDFKAPFKKNLELDVTVQKSLVFGHVSRYNVHIWYLKKLKIDSLPIGVVFIDREITQFFA